MQQLEISYFFPLTEQTPLDLDFKPCEEHAKKIQEERWKNSVSITAGTGLTFAAGINSVTWAIADPSYQTFQVLPDGAVGSWQVTPNMTIGRKTKPKLLHRIFTKYILGWEWKENITKGK
jgi:hypothetical protein